MFLNFLSVSLVIRSIFMAFKMEMMEQETPEEAKIVKNLLWISSVIVKLVSSLLNVQDSIVLL